MIDFSRLVIFYFLSRHLNIFMILLNCNEIESDGNKMNEFNFNLNQEVKLENKSKKKNVAIIGGVVGLVLLVIVLSVVFSGGKTTLAKKPDKFTVEDDFGGLKFELLNHDFSDNTTSFRINIVNKSDKPVYLNGYTLEFLDENDNVIGSIHSGVEITLDPNGEIETSISRDSDLSAAVRYRVVKREKTTESSKTTG